ncbi:aliphatic sulfonate ABC transporter periplasmic ligand-binding protein [Nostoc linckia NIES-25]|nr:aliphatic sulfonate ABC transporter periplasmic ligand-binding protein [Nostoc linckia NIES-25]
MIKPFSPLIHFQSFTNTSSQSKTANIKPIFKQSLNILDFRAKSKINQNYYVYLLITTCYLAMPISIVGCSNENQAIQNQASSISKQIKNQSVSNTTEKQEVRIIYSKLSSLAVMRKLGTLEKSLAAKNFTVKWLEFAAGPQALEALNAGSLDKAK